VIRLALHFLFFLSGAAALGYQLVWTRLFATGLGHEYPALLAIVAAFMIGMALGAIWIDRVVPRDRRAGYWLAGLEFVIGGWALIAASIIPWANDWALTLIGLAPSASRHWLVAFILPALLLLPATMAMGATLPAMEKFLSAAWPRFASIGSVYAANTLGAVGGTIVAAYALMPDWGLSKACGALAALNIAAAIGFITLARTARRQTAERFEPPKNAPHSPIAYARVAATLFLTGLLGISYEVVGVRVLAQVLEGTVYTYAAVLAVFLAGTAAGAGSYHQWWRTFEPRRLLSNLLLGAAVGCLGGIAVLMWSRELYAIAGGTAPSPGRVMAAELMTALAVFGLPTFFMGALFSHLVQLARVARGRIGDVVAFNTLGAALAPAAAVIFLPVAGAKWSLLLVSVGYVALALGRIRWGTALVAVAAIAIAFKGDLRIVDVPRGGQVLDYREGVTAAVAVVEDADRHRTLRVDNRFQMGGTAGADAEYRQAHLPLLLHPTPAKALFLGLGTGISFGAARLYPELEADGVELVPEVLTVMPAFASHNFSPATQPRLHLHEADARRYVRASKSSYDVIVADLFHPYRDGAGALYTREHIATIRARLNGNGLFCQWLPLHQLDEATLRVIVRTFLDVFPDAEAWLLRFNVDVPVVGLIGRNISQSYNQRWIEGGTRSPELSDALKRLSLGDSLRVFGHLLADGDDLRRFSDNAPRNTDDNPRVTFMAPRLNYRRTEKPYTSLFALLRSAKPDVSRTLGLADQEKDFASQILAYIAARNVYLGGLVRYSEGRRDEAIDAYLESARLSGEFTAGYAQCVSIAAVLASSEPGRAKAILEKLIEAQPDRAMAREMLRRLTAP